MLDHRFERRLQGGSNHPSHWKDEQGATYVSTKCRWHGKCDSDGVSRTERERAMTTNVIGVLNDLIEMSRDGERGYMKAAQDAHHVSVKEALLEIADHCSKGVRELQDRVLDLGGIPESGGSVAGALHRGWLDVKTVLGSRTDHAILVDCERGEDVTKKHFRDALKKDLPADVLALVGRLYQSVLQNHARIRVLRDQ
jgi:uncharacterized protein (TIGR02284 family)